MSRQCGATNRVGFTIVEVVVATAVLGLVMGGFGTVLLSSARSLEDQVVLNRARAAGQRAMHRLWEFLPSVEPTSILPTVLADSEQLTFRQITGFDGTSNTLGASTTVRREPMPGETLNSLDDNGDGRVDESFLVADQGGSTTILAPEVVGFRVNSTVSGLDIAVDVEVSVRNGTVRRTFRREWALRNQ